MNRITLYELRKKTPPPYHFDKGLLFEEYIKQLFNDKRFKLKRWRKSAKVPKDTWIADLSLPDLELIYHGSKSKPFAIECKYRARFYNGMLGWASEDQIKKYEHFQNRYSMTVLIAIGVGGGPSNPKKLFITPLDHIKKYTNVLESHLIKFEKHPKQSIKDALQLELFNSLEEILEKHRLAF